MKERTSCPMWAAPEEKLLFWASLSLPAEDHIGNEFTVSRQHSTGRKYVALS